MPEYDDDASNPDLTPAPTPAPQPASSSAGFPPEYGGPPPPPEDDAFITAPAFDLKASLHGLEAKATLPVASLVAALVLVIIGAIIWVTAAALPGIVVMICGGIIPTVWQRTIGRTINNQRKTK